jgi:hypothetical protein
MYIYSWSVSLVVNSLFLTKKPGNLEMQISLVGGHKRKWDKVSTEVLVIYT